MGGHLLRVWGLTGATERVYSKHRSEPATLVTPRLVAVPAVTGMREQS